MTILHAGIATFLGAQYTPPQRDELRAAGATVAILGLPDDTTTVTRSGAGHGPRAIRDASSHFAFGGTYHLDYDVTISDHEAEQIERANASTSTPVVFVHGLWLLPNSWDRWAALFEEAGYVAALIPGARAAARAGVGRMGLVMLDTHLDTAPELDGEELSHCSPVARVLELDNVDGTSIAIIGAHGAANPRLELDAAREHGVHVFTVRDIEREGIDTVARRAIDAVSAGTDGVYLSFDIDVLDGGFAWGTCGPEIGGLTGRELVRALEILSAGRLVAMDCVEVAPFLDPSGNTARIAARAVIDVLAGRIVGRKERGES